MRATSSSLGSGQEDEVTDASVEDAAEVEGATIAKAEEAAAEVEGAAVSVILDAGSLSARNTAFRCLPSTAKRGLVASRAISPTPPLPAASTSASETSTMVFFPAQ